MRILVKSEIKKPSVNHPSSRVSENADNTLFVHWPPHPFHIETKAQGYGLTRHQFQQMFALKFQVIWGVNKAKNLWTWTSHRGLEVIAMS